MKAKITFVLMLTVAIVALVVTVSHPWRQPVAPDSEPIAQSQAESTSAAVETLTSETLPPSKPSPVTAQIETRSAEKPNPAAAPTLDGITNKLQRLNRIRETVAALAAGNPTNAMQFAKSFTNNTERETALLALATQWTQGELGPAQRRAFFITQYGIEAGIGMELVRNPDLAVLWANELTQGPGRTALLEQTAIGMLGSDPDAAFALGQQLGLDEQRKFLDSVFAGWGASDTEAALNRADQIQDPAQRDAAIAAIRTMAPVGIGAQLNMQDGYAIVNQVLPGTPAEASGQLHTGDRILALAQGDNAYVDARGLSLKEIVELIRGAPNTVLQLQVLDAGAGPGTPPRTISIPRDQLKFKR